MRKQRRNKPFVLDNMWYEIAPYVMPVAAVVALVIIGRALITLRLQGKKSGCTHGCSLGCFGVLCLVVLGSIISSLFGSKTLYSGGERRWYMHTYDIDGTTFYSVNVHPTDGLSDGPEPWYTCIGFQGGEAAWKQYPTELYLRQESGALHYFNFETETVRDMGNVPIPGPSVPVETFFRQL